MAILDSIRTPADLKTLNTRQLEDLSGEIRTFLINSISKTGGHLASNLGAVELTLAIHRVFDTERDRLVFDVGHQSYVHKLLTGRREDFGWLRRFGGISGFPKPCESIHDAFVAGHASNSVSVALGMARARTALGADHDVLAVIGDGALTGGLAYEGLCDAGESGEPLIIILNDNGMSIDRNVGGVSRLLARQRVKSSYLSFKRGWRRVVGKCPPVYNAAHRLKERVKDMILGNNMFEDLGFHYLGPVDGHDILAVETVLRWAKEIREPVLVHVITQKGKGWAFAEESPDAYHGVGPFDPEKGLCSEPKQDFSWVFGETLTALAQKEPRIAALTAAMESGTGLSGFAGKYPERFHDVGIAEGHAVSMAAGMAKQGLVPVFAVYSSFLQRGYDMLIHDVALQGLHVVFAVDRAGLVGQDGETHHGLFDLAYLGSVPDMRVLCPSSFAELRAMLETAVMDMRGPVALRYSRGGEGAYKACASGPWTRLREGRDVTIVTHGLMVNQVLEAAQALSARGVEAEIIKLNQVLPLDAEGVLASVKKTGRFVCVEDVCRAGSVGERLLGTMAAAAPKQAKLLDLGEGIVTHGTTEELLAHTGLNSAGIFRSVMEMMESDGVADEESQA